MKQYIQSFKHLFAHGPKPQHFLASCRETEFFASISNNEGQDSLCSAPHDWTVILDVSSTDQTSLEFSPLETFPSELRWSSLSGWGSGPTQSWQMSFPFLRTPWNESVPSQDNDFSSWCLGSSYYHPSMMDSRELAQACLICQDNSWSAP